MSKGEAMFPLLPTKISSQLLDSVEKIQYGARSLERGINPFVIESIENLMLPINSYYTNAMEGNPSRLSDIEAAQNRDFLADNEKRNYQLEHLAHIEVQKNMVARLKNEPNLDITSAEFLCWLHSEFYKRLPEEMHFVKTISGKKEPVFPGKIRDRQAEVGRHLPPEDDQDILNLLNQFSKGLSPANVDPKMQLIALASSHHRLLWIHPFRDGNGRVARLFSTAYSFRVGICPHNLWTVSRAFARDRDKYDFHLALADEGPRNDLDGRGPLSEENLVKFCEYFLSQCLDQIMFMRGLLDFKNLEKRFFLELKLVKEDRSLSKGAIEVLRFLFFKGEIERGEVQSICKVKRRRATEIIKELLESKRVFALSERRGRLRLRFTADSARIIFPDLF